MLHKAPFVFPIVCGRKVEQFMSNIDDLSIRLTDEHVEEIEDVKPFAKDYPWDIIVSLSSWFQGTNQAM